MTPLRSLYRDVLVLRQKIATMELKMFSRRGTIVLQEKEEESELPFSATILSLHRNLGILDVSASRKQPFRRSSQT